MENYIIANCTDVGQARKVNEDSMVTFDSPNGRVVAVCDGMGGQAAGDVASQLACSIIRDILQNNTFSTPEEAITRAVMAANQGILHRAAQNPALAGMGATCVIIIIKDGLIHYGWVGDSRIYYISSHTIRQISRDQSYVQQLVDSGELTPEEAEHHPRKNEILNALGVQGMTPPELGAPLRPEPGSVVLLCSDGLTGMVDNNHIERVVSDKTLSLDERARKLVAKANANGGVDNITVQLVEFNTAAVAPASFIDKLVKNPMMLCSIVAGIVILVAVAFFIFRGSSDKPAATTTKVEDTRSAKSAPAPKATAPAPTQTVTKTKVVDEPSKQPRGKAKDPKNTNIQGAAKGLSKGEQPQQTVPDVFTGGKDDDAL